MHASRPVVLAPASAGEPGGQVRFPRHPTRRIDERGRVAGDRGRRRAADAEPARPAQRVDARAADAVLRPARGLRRARGRPRDRRHRRRPRVLRRRRHGGPARRSRAARSTARRRRAGNGDAAGHPAGRVPAVDPQAGDRRDQRPVRRHRAGAGGDVRPAVRGRRRQDHDRVRRAAASSPSTGSRGCCRGWSARPGRSTCCCRAGSCSAAEAAELGLVNRAVRRRPSRRARARRTPASWPASARRRAWPR